MAKLRKQFGRRLRALRLKSGMTQERFAERVGISVDFLSLVERGINAPSFERLEEIAAALKIDVRELFAFDDEKRSPKRRTSLQSAPRSRRAVRR